MCMFAGGSKCFSKSAGCWGSVSNGLHFDKASYVWKGLSFAAGGFVDTLLSKGVDVVIGFSGLVEQVTGAYWTEQLVYSLSLGNTVEDAMNFADTALYNKYNNTIYSSQLSLILNGRYTGSTNLSLKPCS